MVQDDSAGIGSGKTRYRRRTASHFILGPCKRGCQQTAVTYAGTATVPGDLLGLDGNDDILPHPPPFHFFLRAIALYSGQIQIVCINESCYKPYPDEACPVQHVR